MSGSEQEADRVAQQVSDIAGARADGTAERNLRIELRSRHPDTGSRPCEPPLRSANVRAAGEQLSAITNRNWLIEPERRVARAGREGEVGGRAPGQRRQPEQRAVPFGGDGRNLCLSLIAERADPRRVEPDGLANLDLLLGR